MALIISFFIGVNSKLIKIIFNLIKIRCHTSFAPRNNTFFSIQGVKGSTSKLTLKKIFKILYYWAMDHTILSTSTMIGVTYKIASFWYEKIRLLCQSHFDKRLKFGGNGYVVEIDESLLHGKRKSNRGRYLRGDIWKVSSNKEYVQPCNKL